MPDEAVLVVEDDPEINELVGAYVQIAGFRYRPAFNGQDALREAQTSPPALILLDVMLPDIDGFEICRRVKADPRTAGVRVVLLSAMGNDELQHKGAGCGAVLCMNKPFDPDTLMDVIRDQMGRQLGDGTCVERF